MLSYAFLFSDVAIVVVVVLVGVVGVEVVVSIFLSVMSVGLLIALDELLGSTVVCVFLVRLLLEGSEVVSLLLSAVLLRLEGLCGNGGS